MTWTPPWPDRRGQTESVGVILTLVLVIIVTSVIGSTFVLQLNQEIETERPSAAFDADLASDHLTVRHLGGESFPLSDLVLEVRQGESSERYRLHNETVSDTLDDDAVFEGGETVTFNHSFNGTVRLRLIDTGENGYVLYDEHKTVPSPDTQTTTPPTTTTSPSVTKAFDDVNQNGVYDAGEPTYDKSELYDFDNTSVDLIIPSPVGSLDRESGVSIRANSVTSYVDVDATWGQVSLTATGGSVTTSNLVKSDDAVTLRGKSLDVSSADVRSDYGQIVLEATQDGGGAVTATDSVIDTDAAITVRGVSVDASSATVRSVSGEIAIEATEGSGGAVEATGAVVETDMDVTVTGETVTIDTAEIHSAYGAISLAATAGTGGSVTATDALIETDASVTVTGVSVDVGDGNVTTGYGQIAISATYGDGGQLDATGAAISTDADIDLNSVGDMFLDDARLETDYGQITADLGGKYTLHISGTTVVGTQAILYSPNQVTEDPNRRIARPG